MAIVKLSEILAANHLTLAKGSILFSSSATDEIVAKSGKEYQIEIQSLGKIRIRAI